MSEKQKAITNICQQLLQELGLNLDDPNFLKTPERMARSLAELLCGEHETEEQIARELGTVFPCRKNGLHLVGPVELFSLCPHHLLPVHYSCFIGYIPRKKVVGLSKLPRVARILAARAILQEDLIEDIADAIDKHLEPQGVIVKLTGSHDCLRIRGARSDARFTSSAVRGVMYENPAARQEALELIRTSYVANG